MGSYAHSPHTSAPFKLQFQCLPVNSLYTLLCNIYYTVYKINTDSHVPAHLIRACASDSHS